MISNSFERYDRKIFLIKPEKNIRKGVRKNKRILRCIIYDPDIYNQFYPEFTLFKFWGSVTIFQSDISSTFSEHAAHAVLNSSFPLCWSS